MTDNLDIIEMSLCLWLLLQCTDLFLLLVLGHCSVLTCHLQELFYIDEEHTWREAQSYCRKNHSDLLTVHDMEHFEIFQRLGIQKGEAWIGLQSVSNVGDWQWSQPGVDKASTKWKKGEPNGNDIRIENCAFLRHDGLHDVGCGHKKSFSCYNGEDVLLLFC